MYLKMSQFVGVECLLSHQQLQFPGTVLFIGSWNLAAARLISCIHKAISVSNDAGTSSHPMKAVESLVVSSRNTWYFWMTSVVAVFVISVAVGFIPVVIVMLCSWYSVSWVVGCCGSWYRCPSSSPLISLICRFSDAGLGCAVISSAKPSVKPALAGHCRIEHLAAAAPSGRATPHLLMPLFFPRRP